MRKMAKAIIDYSFFKSLFDPDERNKADAVIELKIVNSYKYEILLPISVLYCTMNTRFKRKSYTLETLKELLLEYKLILINKEKCWSQSIDDIFQHNYGQIATPTLSEMEVRSIIQDDKEIDFLLTYKREKYSDLFKQVKTF